MNQSKDASSPVTWLWEQTIKTPVCCSGTSRSQIICIWQTLMDALLLIFCLSLKQGQLLPFPETLLNNSNRLVVDILTRRIKNIKQSHPSPEKIWLMAGYIQLNQFKASGQSWETHKTREVFSLDTSMTGALENWPLLGSRALQSTDLIAICH